ncbi:SEC-C metal-binding domain-containing protein [Salinactinospora qingdaonensis]|uniref:SEC-C motif-containing protein n=1 Tax=Salinactinospora qingdaonensis TaxID=702744 RepID=A0ABP7FJH3_9ACTN
MEIKAASQAHIVSDAERLRVEARQLEADAPAFPDDRAAILAEAASLWHCLGDDERALRLCGEALATGGAGEGSQLARLRRLEVYAHHGQWSHVAAELRALRAEPVSPRPAHLVAEVLERFGRPGEALEFFSYACGPLLTELDRVEPAEAGKYLVYFDSAEGRARVRAALGMPEDELDAVIRRSYEEETVPLNGVDCVAPQPGDGKSPVAGFVARADLGRSHGWEPLVPAEFRSLGPQEYLLLLEGEWRVFTQCRPGGLTLVPVRVEEYQTFARQVGPSPSAQRLRHDFLRERLRSGDVVHWPPHRNAACWCGAERKYKKCCGAPHRA